MCCCIPAPCDYRPEKADSTVYPKSPSYSIRRKETLREPEIFQFPAPGDYETAKAESVTFPKSPEFGIAGKLKEPKQEGLEFPG